MRSIKVIFSTAIFAVSAPALAGGDLNTYRTGNAYLKVAAPGALACEAQCSGDAQCKSWNFLRSGAPNGSGICEFNSQVSGMTAHPYAISGMASSPAYAGGTVIQGQTRTTRIGQPAPVRPQVQRASTRPIQPQVRRAPAPVTRTRHFATQQMPQAVQPQLGPQSQYLRKPATLGGPLKQVRPTAANTARTAQSPVQARLQHPVRPADPMQPRVYGGTASAGQPASQRSAATPPARAQAPQTVQARTQNMRRPAQPRQQMRAPTRPVSYDDAMAQSSLYGSLYDNVQQKPVAPKAPLYNERPAEDPDAPIATSLAVPTAKVTEDTLAMAGAAPR